MGEPGEMAAQGADAVPRVATAGETMALVVPTAPGRLRHAGAVTLSIGGAESNVAIGLSRLGVPASWVSALGEDELGELVLHRVRAEGVDTSAVRRVPDRPTGRYLREEVAGALRVYYYRRGSAASTLARAPSTRRSSRAPPSCASPASQGRCRGSVRSS